MPCGNTPIMGRAGIARCSDCGHGFRATIGGGELRVVMRCINCDTEVWIANVARKPDYQEKCTDCEGALRIDVIPWCPVCRSKKTYMENFDTLWD